jgi:hypothetical protein
LTAKAQDVFAVLPTGFSKSLIYQVLPVLFSELYRLRHGTIKNFVIAVVNIPLEIVYPRPASSDPENAWHLFIQAVCLDPSFDDETNDFSVFS